MLEHKKKLAEPIFPMRLLKNRVLVGMLLYVCSFPSAPLSSPYPYFSL